MFIHEAEIWKTLKHLNALQLYGASSASSEGPLFFVRRFCVGGMLVSYLSKSSLVLRLMFVLKPPTTFPLPAAQIHLT
jgi:hypothetical protein